MKLSNPTHQHIPSIIAFGITKVITKYPSSQLKMNITPHLFRKIAQNDIKIKKRKKRIKAINGCKNMFAIPMHPILYLKLNIYLSMLLLLFKRLMYVQEMNFKFDKNSTKHRCRRRSFDIANNNNYLTL